MKTVEYLTGTQYMMEAVRDISYKDPPDRGLQPLKELWRRALKTQSCWELNAKEHQYSALAHLFRADEKMKQGQWSYACHELLDVLYYGCLPNGNADALVMQNMMWILKESLNDVVE